MSHGGRGWVGLYREGRRRAAGERKRKMLGLAARAAWGFAVSWKSNFFAGC